MGTPLRIFVALVLSLPVVGSTSAAAAALEPSPQLTRQSDTAGGDITDTYPLPRVTARGWIVHDERTGTPIAGEQIGTPRPIASLAKLMTALVVVDRLDLDSLVTIPQAVNDLPADASIMGARPGEQWKASDLLDAMLVYSANDAAIALSSAVSDGDEHAFIKLMNAQAVELGLDDTHFASVTGLDDDGSSSTSTPDELTTLVLAALDEQPIRDAVAIRELRLTRPNGQPLEPLKNRNPLLGTYDGVDGVKTGFTDAAGYMLAIHQVDADTGGELVVTTFASTSEQTRISDSRALLDWARPLRQRLVVIEGGTGVGSIPVQRSDTHLRVFACDDAKVSVLVGQGLTQEVSLPKSIAPPVRAGDEVGTLSIHGPTTSDDEAIDDDPTRVSVPLCAGDDIEAPSTWERITSRAKDWRSAWSTGIDEVRDTFNSLT